MKLSMEDVERAVYLEQYGWNWNVPAPKPKRRLFANYDDMLLRPTIRREV